MSLDRIVSQRSDVAWKEVDGHAVLLDVAVNKQIHRLNPVGTYIWSQLDGKKSLVQVLDSLCEEFEVERGEAQNDLLNLIKQFEELGVIHGS